VQALATEDVAEGILPELTSVRLEGFHQYTFIVEAVEQFITTRMLFRRLVDVRTS